MEGKELIIMKHGLVRLPPGFRFHPTDEELVVQYLKRKAFSCPLPASIIPEIDLFNYNPWDLPSGFGGERYFFNLRDRKCEANNKRRGGFMMKNQATKSGYWKPTGKEKPVFTSRGHEAVGAKQVLVFYRGKTTHGSKTDWIMHEYRLNEFLGQSKEWVVCQIFEKRRYMKLKARIITSTPSSPEPSSSCITDISDEEEESINGEEAMSRRNHVA